MQENTESSSSINDSSLSSVRIPENSASSENEECENNAQEERPLTFYLPSCHCLEESQKEYEKMRSEMTGTLKTKELNEILTPDHPALERFQAALKEVLIRQIDHLKEEITEYETITKAKNTQREEMGVEAYELQQIVCKQQKILEEYIENVKNSSAAKEELENELRELQEKQKCESENLMKIEKEEKELRNELESINLLLQQTEQWEQDVESEITINKRMTEKTRKDQMKIMEERRKQDLLLYKLQTAVWKLETELETVDMKLEIKEREREELAQKVAEGNTTIDALEAEYRCLMHSWNSVVIAISNRDKVLNCVNEELEKFEERRKTIMCEIEKLRKLTKQEMLENEKLTAIKQRILNDIVTCKIQIDEELNKQKKIERNISMHQDVIDQTVKDIEKISSENKTTESLLSSLVRECNRNNKIIASWEEKIFLLLENETTNNKAIQHLNSQYRSIKSANRKLEITMALSENKYAVIEAKLESQININVDLNNLVKELIVQKQQFDKEVNEFNEQVKSFDTLVVRRQRHADKLHNKITDMVTVIGGKEISPLELKIKVLEKNIEDLKERIKELQSFWMKEQRNVLNLSEKRQEQISNNDLLKKQILIMQQKNLKVSDEVEAIRKQDQKTTRSISNLHNQILMRSESLSKKKNEKSTLDANNDLIQLEFISKLKEAELDCLKLESEIADIEEDKLIISKQLLDVNREVLEWEKRLLLINDTKKEINEEKSAEGEIGLMKIEIHKMEVRQSQLRRAQEKLITDLEQSVFRRESIVAGSEAREKRSKFGFERTKFNFKRRLDDARNKLKQLDNDMQMVKRKIKKVDDEKGIFENQLNQMKNEVDTIKKMTEKAINEYENIKTDRIMQFELLLVKQKKLNLYSDLARGKKPYLSRRNICALMREYDENMEINNKLLIIIENLLSHFPQFIHYLNRAMNTLNLPKLYAGDTNEWACYGYKEESPVLF